jgi:hypothetical protein
MVRSQDAELIALDADGRAASTTMPRREAIAEVSRSLDVRTRRRHVPTSIADGPDPATTG